MAKKKLDQVVYEHIIEQIERGELLQRQHITEQGAADELSVSRTPVRKAFERLVDEGYLEEVENVGVHVKIRPLDSKGFQERTDFIERLVNHYLFDIEKAEIDFETEELKAVVKELEENLSDAERAFEHSILDYFDSLLAYNDNSYSTHTILNTIREISTTEGFVSENLRSSRELIVDHLNQLAAYLEDNNYARARREIRILLNQLKLNVIENDPTL